MAKRTIENCVIMKRNIKARNEDMINDSIKGKCGGIRQYLEENEVIEPCKNCSIYYGKTWQTYRFIAYNP